jgi:hypothetical protein
MDIINNIKTTRQIEILDGKNLATRNPIYLVFQEIYSIASHQSDYQLGRNLRNKQDEYVRYLIDSDSFILANFTNTDNWDDKIEIKNEDGEIEKYSEVVKIGYHDRFVSVFFTKESADLFIKQESHKLKNPYVYVEYIGNRNWQLQDLCKLFGD